MSEFAQAWGAVVSTVKAHCYQKWELPFFLSYAISTMPPGLRPQAVEVAWELDPASMAHAFNKNLCYLLPKEAPALFTKLTEQLAENQQLLRQIVPAARELIARSPNCSPSLLAVFGRKSTGTTLVNTCDNRSTPPDILRAIYQRLMRRRSEQRPRWVTDALMAIAHNPNTPDDVLMGLLFDTGARVREAAQIALAQRQKTQVA